MGIMPLLIICSILVAGGFLIAFLWATKNGQYDDMATPSIKMLFEEQRVESREQRAESRECILISRLAD